MNSPTIIPINLDAEFQKFTDEVLTQAALSGEQDSVKGGIPNKKWTKNISHLSYIF